MGHGMAKNIGQKIPESSILVVYDINPETVHRFLNDYNSASNIKAASSPKEVAELAVSYSLIPRQTRFLYSYLSLVLKERLP